MATTKKINRRKTVKIEVAILFLSLIAIGFFLGRITAPVKVETVTQTETVEVPCYVSASLPEGIALDYYYDIPLSHNLQEFIAAVCADEGVPMSLVLAMIDHESRFNPEIVSKTNDYGLMQINVINHEWLEEQYRCGDMLNPYQNVYCGIKILGSYIAKYEDYTKALMAYNMGNYGANKAWKDGVTSTSYTEVVMKLMYRYERELASHET